MKGSHLGNCVIHDLLVSHIALVSDQELVDAFGGVSVNLLQPLLHVVERIHVGDIVDDADAVGTSVVRRGDGSETLLTCGVPLSGGEGLLAAVSWVLGRGRSLGWGMGWLTICSFTVLPSSSIVRIFCQRVSNVGLGCGDHQSVQSRHRLWRYKTRCKCHQRTAGASRTFQHRSLR